MKPDPVVERTLAHLSARREELKREITQHEAAIRHASQELAKVEQAIVGLKPLGRQSLFEKAGPAMAAVGVGALALLAVIASAQQDQQSHLPAAPDLIIAVLHEGGQMTDAEILERMSAVGWTSAAQDRLGLIRSYLSRLVQAQRVSRVGQSTYRLAIPAVVVEATAAPASTASDRGG
jgi:hypothetical protein